jgi:hypothetical protein
MDEKVTEAKQCFRQRQQEAAQQVQAALHAGTPAAGIRELLAHAGGLGLPPAQLRAAEEACAARDAQAAEALMCAASAAHYDPAAYEAAAQRAAQLGLDAELAAGRRAVLNRQQHALDALMSAAGAADAAGFARALAAARRLEAAPGALEAAAQLFQQRCAVLCASSSAAAAPVAALPAVDISSSTASSHSTAVSQDSTVLSASRVAELAGGRALVHVTALDLGLERLRSFGSALTGCRALVELHARSNKLTSLAGRCATPQALRYLVSRMAAEACGHAHAGLELCAALQVLKLSDNQLASTDTLAPWSHLRFASCFGQCLVLHIYTDIKVTKNLRRQGAGPQLEPAEQPRLAQWLPGPCTAEAGRQQAAGCSQNFSCTAADLVVPV